MNRIATIVNNEVQLKNLLNEIIQECLKEISKETQKYLKQFVETEWYNAHQPEIYNRTYQMLESIIQFPQKQKGNKFEVSIGFDTSKIIPNFLGGDLWNEHMSFNGSSFTEGLIEVLENGNPSPFSPSYARNGIAMLENTAKWLEKELPRIVKNTFAKYGMYIILFK